MTAELGPGASRLLEQCKIRKLSAKPNTKVAESIKEALSKLKTK